MVWLGCFGERNDVGQFVVRLSKKDNVIRSLDHSFRIVFEQSQRDVAVIAQERANMRRAMAVVDTEINDFPFDFSRLRLSTYCAAAVLRDCHLRKDFGCETKKFQSLPLTCGRCVCVTLAPDLAIMIWFLTTQSVGFFVVVFTNTRSSAARSTLLFDGARILCCVTSQAHLVARSTLGTQSVVFRAVVIEVSEWLGSLALVTAFRLDWDIIGVHFLEGCEVLRPGTATLPQVADT